MKIKSKVTLLAATILVGVSQLQAAPTLSQQLDSIPAVEIPAFAVKSVLSAEEDARFATAVKVIRTIAVQNEKALVPTVISITRAIPQFGPKIAAVAAKLSPNQAKLIAVRVAQTVPGLAPDVAYHVAGSSKLTAPKAVEIAELIVRVAPTSTNYVVGAVVNRVPASGSVLFSRFPNAVKIIGGGSISTSSGTFQQAAAQREVDQWQAYVDDGGAGLQRFIQDEGPFDSTAQALNELQSRLAGAQQKKSDADMKANQPLTEKSSNDTEVGTDPDRYGAGG